MPCTETELLTAWRDGDNDAGTALYERHFPVVHRFFRHKVGDDEAVVELIQTTFAASVESLERFRGESSYQTFLLAIARKKLFDHYRTHHRKTDVPIEEATLSELDPSPSSLLRRGRAQRALLTAVRALPIDLQILLELYYWEEIRGPELAEIMGVPEGTVRSRLRRARTLLEKELARIGDEIPERDLASADFDAWARHIKALVD